MVEGPPEMNRFIPQRGVSAWLAVAIATTITTTGCQTFGPRTKTTTTAAGTSTSTAGAEPGGPKTDFHREVGPEQEFNVHVELARFHEAQGDNESAVLEYQKAVEVCEKKGSAQAHAKLGPVQQSLAQRRMAGALDRMGRFAQAEPHYLKALKLAPNDPKVWNDSGYSYYLQNRMAEAERAFRTADSLGPNNSLVQTNLGLVLAAEGKNDEALTAFTKAAGPAVGHANLGYILASMGKTDQARRQYQSAIQLQPGLSPAREALAKLGPPAAAPAATTALASASTPTPARPTAPAIVATSSTPRVKDPQVTRTRNTQKSSAKAPTTTALSVPPIPPALPAASN